MCCMWGLVVAITVVVGFVGVCFLYWQHCCYDTRLCCNNDECECHFLVAWETIDELESFDVLRGDQRPFF